MSTSELPRNRAPPTLADIGPTHVIGRRFLANGTPDGDYGQSSGFVFYGHERDATGRADVTVGTALDGDRLVIASAAEYEGEDYDYGVARLAGDTLFADGFE